MYRNEIKYIVSPQTARIIAGRLKALCSGDPNADASGGYRVTSLYFDDYANSAVADNLSGQLARKKFRIRVYNGSDVFIRLERKIRRDGGCRKDTVRLTRPEYDTILAGGFPPAQTPDPVLRDFTLAARTRLLRPRILVDYRREAYVYEPGEVRITLDRHVSFSPDWKGMFREDTFFAPALDPRNVILEVKFTGFLPASIYALLQQGEGVRQAVSKYTLCSMNAMVH